MTDANCKRCRGTGEIWWAGIYAPRDGDTSGPCIRCRPADFCDKIGLGREARQIRLHGGTHGQQWSRIVARPPRNPNMDKGPRFSKYGREL